MWIKIFKKFQQVLARTAGPVHCLLFAHEKDQAKWTQPVRFVCSFLLGILFGYLMWLLVSINCNLDFLHDHIILEVQFFTIYLFINGFSYACSRNVRAVTLLIFVQLGEKSGRIFLRAAVFGLVICGPLNNMVSNAAEVARVFACTTNLTYNLTKTQFDLMAKPFTDTLQHMDGDINEIQDSFKSLETLLGELKHGVERADTEGMQSDLKKYRQAASNSKIPNAEEIHQQFVRNVENRCKNQLRAGHQVCEEVFSQGFRKCATNFPNWLASAICWPYRIDVICKVNMFGSPEKLCDASQVVPADFGRTYISFLKAEKELFVNSSNLEISQRIHNTSRAAELDSVQMASNAYMNDFEHRKRVFKVISNIVENIMCITFFYMVWKALKYHWRYRSRIDFDNYYLTDYFKHLDARRKYSNQRSVFPMRRLEKYITVDTDELCNYTVHESSIELYHILQLWIETLAIGLFIYLDMMVVDLLTIVSGTSLVSYQQEGGHEVRYRVNGTGLMARLLRTTMSNFNIHERISTSLSNEECLPNVQSVPQSFYIKVILIYFVIVVFIYYGISILRLRRAICSYFFYKREKQRILFLYGTMLRNHASYLDDVRQMAEMNMAIRHIHGKMNIFLILRLSYPKKFGWLGKFNCAKRYCLICSTLEDYKFVICPKCTCPFCRPCSRETNWSCLFCEESLPRDKPSPNDVKTVGVDLYTFRKR